MPWLDIAILLILAIYIIIGLVRGFLKTSVHLGTTILAVSAGILLAPTVALLFTNVLQLDDQVSQLVTNSISCYCISDSGTQINDVYLHEFAQQLLGHDYWVSYAGGVESAEFIAKLSYALTDCIFVLISFFVVYGLVKIILNFTCHFIKAINRKRYFGWVARSCGAIVALFEGIFVILLGVVLIQILLPAIPGVHSFVDSALATSPFSSWLFSVAGDFLDAALLPWMLRFYTF